MKILNILIAFFATVCFNQHLSAQYNKADMLPLNPKATTGKLPNGITYYIMPNSKPEKKVELRLALQSGSVSEDDDQQGLAHMAEHMAFNGTKNFKKNDIVSFLQDIGVGFGSDLNAYTSFDRTVYILPIPTDKPGNLEKGFQVLEDWAQNVTYNTEDIEGERQIILEESRLGKGANDRMLQKWLPAYFNGSRFGSRLPIGKDSIISNFKPDLIRKYYKDWYRPDLMAVIVVGDITKEKGLEMITKHFGSISPIANPRALPPFEFPAYKDDRAVVVTDKEATGFNVQMSWPAFEQNALTTVGDYKDYITESLFNAMLNARFREITQKPNPPFVFAGGSFGGLVKGFNQFSVSAGTGTNDPSKAVKVLINEIERVNQYGFIPAELERAKKNLFSNYESQFKSKDKTESGNFVEEYITLFLDGDAAPGIENEFGYVKQFLPEITLADVNKLADKLKENPKRFVNITGPEKTENFKLPTDDELVAMVNTAAAEKVTAYEEKTIATDLLSKKPVAGKVTKKTTNKILGSTELLLSNGVTVTLKPTDFKADEIKLQGARYGGSSNYNLKDKFSAQYATAVQAAMGFGSFAPQDLTKVMSGKKASAGVSYTETKDVVSGNATIKDLETMFQMLYLKVTDQRKDTALFTSFVNKNKAQVAGIMSNPQAAFIDTMYKFISGNNPMAPIAVPHAEYFDKINLDRAMQIYKERSGDVTGMQFVIVGSFTEEAIIPLIEKYIASLPANGTKTAYKDNKVRPIRGNKLLEFKKGKEQKSLVMQLYSGDVAYSEDAALKAEAMTEALNIKIIEEIREKAQAIYGGGVFGGLQKDPYPGYTMMAQLPTGPEKVETVLTSLKGEIEKIQKNGPAPETLEKVKKQWLEKYRENLKDNDTWANVLLDAKVEGSNTDRFINYEKYVKAITVADVQKAAKIYLNPANMITAVQLPEKAAEKTPLVIGDRITKVIETFDITDAEVTIDIVDNAEADGDQVTLYFNGTVVASKQTLTEKTMSYKVKAVKGTNNIIMFAENEGTTPPNTALMLIRSGGKEYRATVRSDLKESGAVQLNFK
ncbi:MAG: M16 family metallopeptidase [Ferruginibacter sp.]